MREGDFRAMTSAGQDVLATLLRAEFRGRDALRQQVASATAHVIEDDGSLAFSVIDGARADIVRRVPVEAELEDVDGVTIHVLLHVADGMLDELEIFREDSRRVQRPTVPTEFRVIVL
jgi:hypothetical protein